MPELDAPYQQAKNPAARQSAIVRNVAMMKTRESNLG